MIRSAFALCAALLALTSVPAFADAKRGETLFAECIACHVLAGEPGIGPDLRGVFGRKAGTREDFRYSPAMRRSGIEWTPQSLDAYIADPQKAIPANRMPYAGMQDARDRADLIEYMRQTLR